MTLGERVQLGEAAFVEAPTKTDARDAQQEAFAAVELVAPALAEAGAQRVGQPHRVVASVLSIVISVSMIICRARYPPRSSNLKGAAAAAAAAAASPAASLGTA